MINPTKLTYLIVLLGIFCPTLSGAQELGEEPGIFRTFQTKFPVTLWPATEVIDASNVLSRVKPSPYASINEMRNRIALSVSQPKLSTADSERLTISRLELLYANGALDPAEALASMVSWYPPLVRNEVEKILLMSSRPDGYCARLVANDFLEAQEGMKIYCYMRQNKYSDAKALFEQKAENFAPMRSATLTRFLEIDENIPELDEAWTVLPQPLDFVMDEAFGRPRGAIPLPPAYAYFAREIGTSPQQSLEFTEDLTRTSALPANVLMAGYRNYFGQEESGVKYRAMLIQALAAGNLEPNTSEFDQLIRELYFQFSEVRLLDPIASQFAPFLSKLDIKSISNLSTRNLIIRLGLIGNWSDPEWINLIPKDDYNFLLAFRIRHPELTYGTVPNFNLPTKRAQILNQIDFNYQRPPNTISPTGLAMLDALTIIESIETRGDEEVKKAFSVLFDSGQLEEAKNIALSILFGGIAP